MKNIVLFASAAARERRGKHRLTLLAIHQSDRLPPELLRPVPRMVRWKKSQRFFVALEITFALISLCIWIVLWAKLVRMDSEGEKYFSRYEQFLRHRVVQAANPGEREKAELAIHKNAALKTQFHRFDIISFTAGLLFMVVGPITYAVTISFCRVRWVLLLRDGMPARATITGCSRGLFILSRIELGFTTERGDNVRKTLWVAAHEYSLFAVGDSLWVLYLPHDPKRVLIYGLKSQIAKLVEG